MKQFWLLPQNGQKNIFKNFLEPAPEDKLYKKMLSFDQVKNNFAHLEE